MGKLVHGFASRGKQDATYKSWVSMHHRCKETSQDFPNYGARGISVCARWDLFENFLADMGERPDGMSLDRINNDGNYEPGNCRWITHAGQCNNRRSTHLVTFNGETRSLSEWSRHLGMSKHGIQLRLRKGWTLEQALSTPKLRQGAYRNGSGGRSP
jgi:hypothetical protein